MLQSVTMRNSLIHYDPAILKPWLFAQQMEMGLRRAQRQRHNQWRSDRRRFRLQPRWTKFVDLLASPAQLELSVFTRGMSVAVRQARLSMTEKKLTLYHVLYTPQRRV
jgi:hypothetical protein